MTLHYIGDHCLPDGHVEHMLLWLEGEISDDAYFELFDRSELDG